MVSVMGLMGKPNTVIGDVSEVTLTGGALNTL